MRILLKVKRFYKIKTPGDVGFEFRYFVVKDGMVVFSGTGETLDMATNQYITDMGTSAL